MSSCPAGAAQKYLQIYILIRELSRHNCQVHSVMLDYKTDFFILFGVSVREQTHCRPLLQRVLQTLHSRIHASHSRIHASCRCEVNSGNNSTLLKIARLVGGLVGVRDLSFVRHFVTVVLRADL